MKIINTLLLLLIVSGTRAQHSSIMYLIQLKGSKAELRQTNGNLVRYIGNNDVVFADLNSQQEQILITTNKGKVELRQLNGNLVCYIGNNDATSARWIGEEIQISTQKGKTEIRKINGNLLRTF